MRQIKVVCVAGARPNFIKIAPLRKEFEKNPMFIPILVHTGQHYDKEMSKLFFEELEIPEPNINLEVGSCSHAVQTGLIMQRFETVLLKEKPDLVVVVGDVNSTIACALTSVKLQIPVAHVEAGLRSFDRSMPEEINRILTDAISDFLFTIERSANENLLREGISKERIFFVGNVMIDTLLAHKQRAENSNILRLLGIQKKSYALITLHRPSNVDNLEVIQGILKSIQEIAKHIPIVFPLHPRTRSKIDSFNLWKDINGGGKRRIKITAPIGYLDFLKLMSEARLVLTDSGGIQEETTILGIPCLTLRDNTERPVTLTEGTNKLVGTDPARIISETLASLNGHFSTGHVPELWDGKTANRIVQILEERFT